MMTRTSISFLVAAALVGCGDNGSDDNKNPPGGPDDPQNPDGEKTVDAAGTYRVRSTFDVMATMPSANGAFIDGLIAATDDPDDPMSWVLDQMLNSMQPSTFKTVLQTAKPFVAGYLNGKVTMLAPDLVGTLTEVGHRMADLTKNFGLNEKLYVISSEGNYIGHVVVDGARFKVGSGSMDVAFADVDLDDVTAESIHVTYENAHLGIGDHTLPIEYGKLMRVGLDLAVIPAIDPTATGLADLLDNVVDCAGVGASVANAAGVGSAAFWKSVCLSGLDQAADKIYDQILDSNSMVDFKLLGQARASDSNGDYKLDKLTFGEWSGSLSHKGTDAALAQPAKFDGERM